MKILLVEDEPSVMSFLKRGLEEHDFEVVCAADGLEGLRLAFDQTFDLVVLDLILPKMNGLELCKKLRQQENFQAPIIMLTALGTTDDVVTGLDSGADDYLVKPFKFKELLARINAHLRRRNYLQTNQKLALADLEMDLAAKTVTRSGNPLRLTAREFNLLEFLLQNKGRVLSRMAILENVWDINFELSTNVVDVYVNYLRNKIDKNYSPKLIHTVVGMGYVMKEES